MTKSRILILFHQVHIYREYVSSIFHYLKNSVACSQSLSCRKNAGISPGYKYEEKAVSKANGNFRERRVARVFEVQDTVFRLYGKAPKVNNDEGKAHDINENLTVCLIFDSRHESISDCAVWSIF